jgi:hypothetical protein
MKTTRIITVAAGLAVTAGLVVGLATLSLASTPAAEHHLKATLTISPGALRFTAIGGQLEVVDATGSGRGWHVVLGGNVRVNSYWCAPDSTCTLPVPGVIGDVITADPGTGMGSVIFNVTVSGPVTVNPVTVNLLSGPWRSAAHSGRKTTTGPEPLAFNFPERWWYLSR